MSRIGNKKINILKAKVEVIDKTIKITGPKGELELILFDNIDLNINENTIELKRNSEEKDVKAKHGLVRSLLNNAVIGVSEGFIKKMFLQGIGYRVQLKGKDLEFSLGYSHPVLFKALPGITFQVDGQDKFSVSGIDLQKVGQVCANIKKLRRKDAYKGKGIFYEGEQIKKKPGKSVK